MMMRRGHRGGKGGDGEGTMGRDIFTFEIILLLVFGEIPHYIDAGYFKYN